VDINDNFGLKNLEMIIFPEKCLQLIDIKFFSIYWQKRLFKSKLKGQKGWLCNAITSIIENKERQVDGLKER